MTGPTYQELIKEFEATHSWDDILQGRELDPDYNYTKFAAHTVLEHQGFYSQSTAALKAAHIARKVNHDHY